MISRIAIPTTLITTLKYTLINYLKKHDLFC